MQPADLDAIDALLAQDSFKPDGHQSGPPWYTVVCIDMQAVKAELRALGVIGFAYSDPIRRGRKYERSRWVCLMGSPKADDDMSPDVPPMRVSSELHLRATERFGRLTLDAMPYWIGGIEHGDVGLVTRRPVGTRTYGQTNKYGFPPGSKEYMEAYKKANKGKFQAAQRRYNARVHEAMKLLRAARNVVQAKVEKPPKPPKPPKPEKFESLSLAEQAIVRAGLSLEEFRAACAQPRTWKSMGEAEAERKAEELKLKELKLKEAEEVTTAEATPPALPDESEQPEPTYESCPNCGSDTKDDRCTWCGWPNIMKRVD